MSNFVYFFNLTYILILVWTIHFATTDFIQNIIQGRKPE